MRARTRRRVMVALAGLIWAGGIWAGWTLRAFLTAPERPCCGCRETRPEPEAEPDWIREAESIARQ